MKLFTQVVNRRSQERYFDILKDRNQLSYKTQTYYIIVLLQILCLTCIKLSCMLFYRRIFNFGSRYLLGMMTTMFDVLIVIWGLGFALSFAFSCGTNFAYLWTDLANLLKCPANLTSINLGLSISDTIFDAIIFFLPIPLVSSTAEADHQHLLTEEVLKLHMSKTRRMAVLGIFALGAA